MPLYSIVQWIQVWTIRGPKVLVPETAEVVFQPLPAFICSMCRSTILLEYIVPIRVSPLQPWFDMGPQDFYIVLGGHPHPLLKEVKGALLPITANHPQDHNMSWMLGFGDHWDRRTFLDHYTIVTTIIGLVNSEILFVGKNAHCGLWQLLQAAD